MFGQNREKKRFSWRWAVLLVALVAGSLLLVACSDSDPSPTATTEPTSVQATPDEDGDAMMDEDGDAMMDEDGDAMMDEDGDAMMDDEDGDAMMDEDGDAMMDEDGDAMMDDPQSSANPQSSAPTQVSLTPAESWSCIFDQHELTALLMDDSAAVSNGRIEFFLNRFPAAVGDIVEVDGNGPTKMTNTFAIVQTTSDGEATTTLVATRPGDTDVTAFAPGIQNDSEHKVFGVVHWVDGCPSFPGDAENPIGTPHAMSVSILRVSDGSPVQGMAVRWTITDDDPDARFVNAPGDGNVITTTTNASGVASVTLQQVAGAIGDNGVLIEVLSQDRKTMFSHTIVKRWKSAVLDVSASGPAQIGLLANATYDITVSNTGDFNATGTELTAVLPAGLEFVSATDSATVSGSNVIWDLGTVATDGSVSVSLTAKGIQTGDQVINYRAASDEGLSASTTTTTEVIRGGLEVTKTGPEQADFGSQVTYAIDVTGTGTGASTGIQLVDTVPTGMSFVSAAVGSQAVTPTTSGNQITIALGTLNPDQETSVAIVLQANQTGDWTNQVTVTSAEGATATDEAATTVVQPTLAITKTGPATALLNAEFEYTITVTNNGDGDATGTTVVDTLPAGLEYVSSDPAGTVSGSTVTWNVGDLDPAGSSTITLTVKGTTGGAKENVATASSGGNTLQPEARATTTILVPGITVEKTGRPALFVGNQVTYTLTASNAGDAPLTGVTVTDTIPTGMSYVSSSPAGTESGSTVTWDVGDLAVGASTSVSVTLQGDQVGSVTNTANASAAEGVSDSATLPIRILPAPGATLQITDSFDPVSEGEEVDFTVTVSNQGRSPMTGVRIVVPIPTEFTIVSTSDSTQATISADRRTVTFELDGSLATGDSFSFTITVSANEQPGSEIRQDTVTTATLTYIEFSEPVSTDEGTTVIEQ